MAPKKATTTAAKGATAAHPSYKDMVKKAIIDLKDRSGSSRQAIKKYVKSNNDLGNTTDAAFDKHINQALASGEKAGEFNRPKGPSGPVKLAKKDAAPKPAATTTKKPAAKPAAESTTSKSTTAKKTSTTKKPAAAPKKTSTTKSKTTTKANTAKKAAPKKTAAPAPAVQDKPTVLTKTKSGRVAKTTKPETVKKTATKKTATKKATPKKATPKKAEAAS